MIDVVSKLATEMIFCPIEMIYRTKLHLSIVNIISPQVILTLTEPYERCCIGVYGCNINGDHGCTVTFRVLDGRSNPMLDRKYCASCTERFDMVCHGFLSRYKVISLDVMKMMRHTLLRCMDDSDFFW